MGLSLPATICFLDPKQPGSIHEKNDECEQRSQSHTGQQECDCRRNMVADFHGRLRITMGGGPDQPGGTRRIWKDSSLEKFLSRSFDAATIG